MDDPRALKLFEEILRKTTGGRLAWEATASESEYIAALPGGLTVAIYPEQDSWGNSTGFVLVLRGPEGDLLTITTNVDGVTYSDLSGIYELAKRRALRVDAKVDKLLGELTKL